jgi:hypothetical protein
MVDYDREGYNQSGFNVDGYNRDGYDKNGLNRLGRDSEGYDKYGFKDCIHRNGTLFNEEGFSEQGLDKGGFNKDGFTPVFKYKIRGEYKYQPDYIVGPPWVWDDPKKTDTYKLVEVFRVDRNGYDENGFDVDGYDAEGLMPVYEVSVFVSSSYLDYDGYQCLTREFAGTETRTLAEFRKASSSIMRAASSLVISSPMDWPSLGFTGNNIKDRSKTLDFINRSIENVRSLSTTNWVAPGYNQMKQIASSKNFCFSENTERGMELYCEIYRIDRNGKRKN